MTKKNKTSNESVVHHVHHKEDKENEYGRVITLTGATSTVTIASNNPKETLVYISNIAVALFKQIKEMDQHVE